MKLNKSICFGCCKKSAWYNLMRSNYVWWFNENWEKGKVYCEVNQIYLSVNLAPERCVYYLEHVVTL